MPPHPATWRNYPDSSDKWDIILNDATCGYDGRAGTNFSWSGADDESDKPDHSVKTVDLPADYALDEEVAAIVAPYLAVLSVRQKKARRVACFMALHDEWVTRKEIEHALKIPTARDALYDLRRKNLLRSNGVADSPKVAYRLVLPPGAKHD